MESASKEQFMAAIFRLKKAAAYFPETDGLPFSELAVMCRVSAGCAFGKDGFSVSQIQQEMHISKPAVSQVLNNLEKKGYIVRAIDSGDRRKITVTLTRDGESELASAIGCRDRLLERVFEEFGHENVRTLIRLVNRLMDILEETGKAEQNERCELS